MSIAGSIVLNLTGNIKFINLYGVECHMINVLWAENVDKYRYKLGLKFLMY